MQKQQEMTPNNLQTYKGYWPITVVLKQWVVT